MAHAMAAFAIVKAATLGNIAKRKCVRIIAMGMAHVQKTKYVHVIKDTLVNFAIRNNVINKNYANLRADIATLVNVSALRLGKVRIVNSKHAPTCAAVVDIVLMANVNVCPIEVVKTVR